MSNLTLFLINLKKVHTVIVTVHPRQILILQIQCSTFVSNPGKSAGKINWHGDFQNNEFKGEFLGEGVWLSNRVLRRGIFSISILEDNDLYGPVLLLLRIKLYLWRLLRKLNCKGVFSFISSKWNKKLYLLIIHLMGFIITEIFLSVFCVSSANRFSRIFRISRSMACNFMSRNVFRTGCFQALPC